MKHSKGSIRFATLNAFVDRRLKDLVPKGLAAPLVWFVLFRHAYGNKVRRGIRQLSRETGLDRKTVRSALQTLLDAEIIWIVEEGRAPTYEMATADLVVP